MDFQWTSVENLRGIFLVWGDFDTPWHSWHTRLTFPQLLHVDNSRILLSFPFFREFSTPESHREFHFIKSLLHKAFQIVIHRYSLPQNTLFPSVFHTCGKLCGKLEQGIFSVTYCRALHIARQGSCSHFLKASLYTREPFYVVSPMSAQPL